MTGAANGKGPLAGVRIIEMGGIGPGPFGAMLLADHGAEVIRIDRPNTGSPGSDAMKRSRLVVELDLKSDEGKADLKRLIATADVLIEGFRPGVMEKLGLGPDELLGTNPRLVYARITGWGQKGPYAKLAGHDLNYVALSGGAHMSGPAERPIAPPAMLGDMGGGGMFLAYSIASALLHAERTGEGQVIDCSMTQGSALLATMFYGMKAAGLWEDERGVNVIDGGAHFYGAYRTSDDKFISIGSIEPQFYALLLEKLGLTEDPEFQRQMDKSLWPKLSERLEKIFAEKTRDEWCEILGDSDVCFAPVLSMEEAPSYPQNVEFGTFTTLNGVPQPAPGPHFSKTALAEPRPPKNVSVADLLAE